MRAENMHSRARSRLLLVLSLAIAASILLIEVIGGIITDSLALLADAGHVASDVGALALTLTALLRSTLFRST